MMKHLALAALVSSAALFGCGFFFAPPPFVGTLHAKLTYISSALSNSSGATQTFSSQNIGAASGDRLVIVAVGATGPSNASLSGVTIAGSAATQLAAVSFDPSSLSLGGIYGLLVPSGTTATISVTTSASVAREAISIYTLTGTGGVLTPFSTNTGTGSSIGPISANVTTSKGLVVAVASGGISSGTAGITWSGPTGDYTSSFSNTAAVMSSASMGSAAASQSVSATLTGGSVGSAGLNVTAVGW